MSKIPSAKELNYLYLEKKLSLSEIADSTGYKTHKIIYWMDKLGIKRRDRSEANYIKANPKGEPFTIRDSLTRNEVKLKYLALGLYWGEGGKAPNRGVRITNSDPGVIRVFLEYLTKICSAKDDKIHFYLQTFKDNDLQIARNYWAEQLKVDTKRINTGTPIPSMGKGTYKKISLYGVMSLGFFNSHLQLYILNELGKLGMK